MTAPASPYLAKMLYDETYSATDRIDTHAELLYYLFGAILLGSWINDTLYKEDKNTVDLLKTLPHWKAYSMYLTGNNFTQEKLTATLVKIKLLTPPT